MATPITRTYRHVDLVMVRATTDPGDLEPPDLDLSNPTVIEHDGRDWLAKTWARTDVREALHTASPALAVRIDELLQAATGPTTIDGLRRTIISVASYLLRWQRRGTPFGLFAGVTTASIGRAAATVGTSHRVLARVDAEWLTMFIDRIERHPGLRPRLAVVTNSAGIVRDGRWIVTERCEVGARTPGSLRDGPPRQSWRPDRLVLSRPEV